MSYQFFLSFIEFGHLQVDKRQLIIKNFFTLGLHQAHLM